MVTLWTLLLVAASAFVGSIFLSLLVAWMDSSEQPPSRRRRWPPEGYIAVVPDRDWPDEIGPNPFGPAWRPAIPYVVLTHGPDRTARILARIAERQEPYRLAELLSWPTIELQDLREREARLHWRMDTVN